MGTDTNLIQKAQNGDRKAFDALVVKYQRRIINLVANYLHDNIEAVDLSQEVFLKAYQAIPYFQGNSAFYTWLYRIAINTAKNYIALQHRRPPNIDVDIQDAIYNSPDFLEDQADPESNLARDELELTLINAVNALPEELRMVLTLREIDGLSYEKIAETMRCPIGTVRSRIYRAREAIDQIIASLYK